MRRWEEDEDEEEEKGERRRKAERDGCLYELGNNAHPCTRVRAHALCACKCLHLDRVVGWQSCGSSSSSTCLNSPAIA